VLAFPGSGTVTNSFAKRQLSNNSVQVYGLRYALLVSTFRHELQGAAYACDKGEKHLANGIEQRRMPRTFSRSARHTVKNFTLNAGRKSPDYDLWKARLPPCILNVTNYIHFSSMSA